MTTKTRTMYADEIVAGTFIIPPGKAHPVEVLAQFSDPGNADYFEFACWGRGRVAVRLHRSETVEVVSHHG